jgi:hypothetical protein
MSNYGSRKFIIAASQGAAAIVGFFWGLALCVYAQDVAIVFAAFGVVSGAVLKLYSDANLKENGGDT